MFGIGGFEFFLILIFIFLVFGPDRLPEIVRKIGKFAARFKEAREDLDPALRKDVQAVTDAAMNETDMPEEPFKDSIDALDRAVNTMSGAAAEAIGSESSKKKIKKTIREVGKGSSLRSSESEGTESKTASLSSGVKKVTRATADSNTSAQGNEDASLSGVTAERGTAQATSTSVAQVSVGDAAQGSASETKKPSLAEITASMSPEELRAAALEKARKAQRKAEQEAQAVEYEPGSFAARRASHEAQRAQGESGAGDK